MTPSYSLSGFLKKLSHLRFRKPTDNRDEDDASREHPPATGGHADYGPAPGFAPGQIPPPRLPIHRPHESTTISTIYRDTSDYAETFLPPVQAVAGMVPGFGSVIEGAIGGILGTLHAIDKYIQNKDDLETLTRRLHRLRRHMDNAPIAHTRVEEDLRYELLCALQTTKSQLERMENRIRGSPSLTQDIARCITTINNHLFEYMIFSQMQLQNDIFEMKKSVAESYFRQAQYIENVVMTGGAGRLPTSISRGHAVLVDATGREHTMLLDQCQSFDQLDVMLRASLFQCTPDEAEVQRWYIDRGRYDFIIYKHSGVIELTKENDAYSNLQAGTKIVARVVNEEFTGMEVRTTYNCPCGTPSTVDGDVGNLVAALQRGFTITCRHCGRRCQITLNEGRQVSASKGASGTTPIMGAKSLIRNFVVKRVMPTEWSMPLWWADAAITLHVTHPDGQFETILRCIPPTQPEPMMACLDCPGKLYKLGLGDSLSNFEVTFTLKIGIEWTVNLKPTSPQQCIPPVSYERPQS